MTTSSKKQRPPKIGMLLEQREWMYTNEMNKWLFDHPYATQQQKDEMHRRLAEKWQV